MQTSNTRWVLSSFMVLVGLSLGGLIDSVAAPNDQKAAARTPDGVKALSSADSMKSLKASDKGAKADAEAPWDDLGETDGVHVWSKTVSGNPFVAFRGETVINSSLAKIAQVLSDTTRKLEWIHGAEDAKDLAPLDPTNPFERYEYNRTDSGVFVVADRDFVFRAWTEFDLPNQTLVIRLKSVKHPQMPETDAVRGDLMQSIYVLKILGPEKTRVMVEVHADPKGLLPKFLVNLFQKDWPVKTLAGIRAQAARKDVLEMGQVKDIFSGKYFGYLPPVTNPEELLVKTGGGRKDTLSRSASSPAKTGEVRVAEGDAPSTSGGTPAAVKN